MEQYNRLRYFSLFSGVGGFEIGIGKNGECVGFSEIDKFCNQVLKYRFPNVKNYGDCTKINWSEVPDFDLLVGGSPCQDFSIAGKRKGVVGEKGQLVWEFIRCLKEKKPKYFIFENVKGLMSSRRGFDFANLLVAFSEAGYNLWWQVLNAKDFGVPQNRERVFIVGFREECPPEIFFEPKGDGKDNKKFFKTLNSSDWRGANRNQGQNLIEITKKQSKGYRVYNSKGIATTITGQSGGVGAKTGLYLTNKKIRRLTPLECERLMNWSDNWTKYGINEKEEKVEISDTQRYKMCGNGVVSVIIKFLLQKLLKVG